MQHPHPAVMNIIVIIAIKADFPLSAGQVYSPDRLIEHIRVSNGLTPVLSKKKTLGFFFTCMQTTNEVAY